MHTKQFIIAVMLLPLFFIGNALSAQIIEFQAYPITYNQEDFSAIVVVLPGEKKEVKAHWESFLESQYGLSVKGNGLFGGNTLRVEDAQISSISDRRMDLYARASEEDGEVSLAVFGSFGYDFPLNQQQFPIAYQQTRNMISSFYRWHYNALYQEEISTVEETLESLTDSQAEVNKERAKLRGELDDNRKNLGELQAESRELEKKIYEREKRLDSLKAAQENQRLMLEAMGVNKIDS